jgi:hypothetical protein
MSSLPFWSSSWGQSLDWFVPRLSAVAVGPTPNGRASWRAATVLVARSVRRGGPELPFRTFCTVVVTLPRGLNRSKPERALLDLTPILLRQ